MDEVKDKNDNYINKLYNLFPVFALDQRDAEAV